MFVWKKDNDRALVYADGAIMGYKNIGEAQDGRDESWYIRVRYNTLLRVSPFGILQVKNLIGKKLMFW